MLKQSSIFVVSLVCVAFSSYALAKSSSDYLKEYQTMVDHTHKQAVAAIPPATPPKAPSTETGQAALIAPRSTLAPTLQETPIPQANTEPAQSAPADTKRPTNSGPPNIFITPGGNNNSNSNSVIHY